MLMLSMSLLAWYLQHFDPQVVQKDLSFVRRVQELSKKTNSLHNREDEEDEEGESVMEGELKPVDEAAAAPVLTAA